MAEVTSQRAKAARISTQTRSRIERDRHGILVEGDQVGTRFQNRLAMTATAKRRLHREHARTRPQKRQPALAHQHRLVVELRRVVRLQARSAAPAGND